MDSELVLELSNQIKEHRIEAEFLILGCDKEATIFRVDRYGLVTNHTDIGFSSIGIGGIHSSAHFMLASYSHGTGYYRALYQTFKAKKRAEVAPGVGEFTEMFLVTRDGASPVDRKVIEALENVHKEDTKRLGDRVVEVEDELNRYFRDAYPASQSDIG